MIRIRLPLLAASVVSLAACAATTATPRLLNFGDIRSGRTRTRAGSCAPGNGCRCTCAFACATTVSWSRQVVASSGNVEVDGSAMQIIESAVFRPGLLNGCALHVWVVQPFMYENPARPQPEQRNP